MCKFFYPIGLGGIQNIGQSCFLAASIQIFLSTNAVQNMMMAQHSCAGKECFFLCIEESPLGIPNIPFSKYNEEEHKHLTYKHKYVVANN